MAAFRESLSTQGSFHFNKYKIIETSIYYSFYSFYRKVAIFSCFLPPTNTHVTPLWPIVQCRFIFRHLVTMSGAWGMRSVGQQLMNSIHTVIHKLYAPIVTYSFILWEHVRSSEGRGRSHGVNAQANWEDNVVLERRAVDSRGFTGFLKINWRQQHVGFCRIQKVIFSRERVRHMLKVCVYFL